MHMMELAKSAGLKKDHGQDREYIGNFEWREFGRLMANECARLVEEHQPQYMTEEQTRIVADNIRKHFGVL